MTTRERIKEPSSRRFSQRQGRLTSAQVRNLQQGLPRYGIDQQPAPMQLNPHFLRHAPLYVDIGFGNGISLIEMAKAQPDVNFLGIEVYKPGMGQLIRQLENDAIQNVRLMLHDAMDVMCALAPDQLDRVQVFFPDPWPKRRHHKRRLLQPDFIAHCVRALRSGGVLHVATDWQPYADQVLQYCAENTQLYNTCNGFAPRPDYRPKTKFEQRGKCLGHAIRDLIFKKTAYVG